jgi:amino acid transporter
LLAGQAQRHTPFGLLIGRGGKAGGGDGPDVALGLQQPGHGSGELSQAAQWLFLTSLFAAALAFHNCVWRYIFALGREGVLPAAFGRTGPNSIPKAASLAQSLTGLAAIIIYAAGDWPPMTDLFFWLGTTGGFGILVLLATTAVAVIAFFARDPRGESAWSRLIAPRAADRADHGGRMRGEDRQQTGQAAGVGAEVD